MASGTKKRRKSQSPARGTTSKRARVASSGTSNRTRHDDHDSHSSRAGSVRNTQATSLPTGEDWVFRVKVISSATDLGNDVFKNAVQGLVRICFPNGILDQLGSDVLEKHMREEKAPEENIRKMTEIFHTEMTQRMVSMLVDNLDTAAKVDSVLKAMLTASAKAHGDDLGEDVLGYVTDSFLQMKAMAPKHSTEWLVNGDAVREDSSGEDVSASDASDEESTPPPKVKKHRKRDKESERARPSAEDHNPSTARMHNNLPATSLKQRTSKSKDRKISSKWQWDIEASDLTEDEVSKTFFRTSDLFAYHALPISQRKLGPSASKKEIRCEMQSLLDGMPQEEFGKWVESLQKLLDGDRDMLERQESHSSGHQQQLSRVTPAPIETRKHSRKAMGTTSGSSNYPGTDLGSGNGPSGQDTFVKREVVVGQMEQPHTPNENHQKDSLSEATATLRQVSIEERHTQSPVQVEGSVDNQDLRSCGNLLDQVPVFEREIPTTILLWGRDDISPSQRNHVTETIMANINRRISVDYVRGTEADGTPKALTKTHLRNTISGAFPELGKAFSSMGTLKIIEQSLVPWVIVIPSAFPELQAMPFVFINTRTYVTIATNLLFGSWTSISKKTGFQVWALLLQALQRRGMGEDSLANSFINFARIDKFCKKSSPDTTKRLAFERLLRRVAFFNREKFPELKATTVVACWEGRTRLKW